MKEYCLFIGGDYDGDMVFVETDRPYWELPAKKQLLDSKQLENIIAEDLRHTNLHILSYKREACCDMGGEYYIYFHGGRINTPIRNWIDHYHRMYLEKKRLEIELQNVHSNFDLTPKRSNNPGGI